MSISFEQKSKIIITCPKFIAPYLSKEVTDLGYTIIDQWSTGVAIEGTINDCIKLNFYIRTGNQVLWLIKDFEAVNADACEITSLDNAHLDNCQVLVAATGDDKANLVTSLLGKTEYGVPRVVARINHPKNEWLFDSSWGVDVAVSTPRIIAALVEEAVSVGDVVRLFSFKKGQANLVELTLPDGSACIGKTVEEIELPEDATLAAIVRDGRVITAKAHDVFAAGDELLFIASSDAEARIKTCFISS